MAKRKPRTPEQKARLAEQHRKRYAGDPEYRARRSEIQRKRYAEDTEYRARHLEANRKRREDPEYRARQAEYSRKREYGLMPGQYTAMLDSQGRLCAICRKSGDKRGLAVDHCHETGAVRGLLCSECNIGMGKLGDTPEGLMRAVRYLREARKRQQLPLEI